MDGGVIRREGLKFVAKANPGDRIERLGDKFIITSPDSSPRIIVIDHEGNLVSESIVSSDIS